MSTMEKNNNQLLIHAAERGDVTEVQRFIPISNPKDDNSRALQLAAAYGHTECVELLIPVSDPNAYGSKPLRMAVQYGHLKCINLLLPVSHVQNITGILHQAAMDGNTEYVKLLIPFSTPKKHDSYALRLASEKRQFECVDLLFDVSDYDAALAFLKHQFPDQPCSWEYLERKIAQRQKNLLSNAIDKINHCSIGHKRKI